LKSDGSIAGWGNNVFGGATPPDANDFVGVAAGVGHGLALRSDGSIVGWGMDHYGESTPPDGNDFVAIAAGAGHSLALKSDGSIVGWGWNASGQATPPDGNDFVAIAAGMSHSLAIRRNCEYMLSGDLNDDCKVDFSDLALMAAHWLIDCDLNPTDPACVPK
jgi:alpha-tubulin suppressor-like RCC1 family protein